LNARASLVPTKFALHPNPAVFVISYLFNPLDALVLHLWSRLLGHRSPPLKITNRRFRHASPHLWNHLPLEFRQPHPSSHPSSPASHHHHYSLSLHLYFTLALKLFFSTNPSHCRCLSPTRLPSWTQTASVLRANQILVLVLSLYFSFSLMR